MREVAATLNSSSTTLFSSSVRLAEAGQNQEALLLIDLVGSIHEADDKLRGHTRNAVAGMTVKLSRH